MDMDRRGFLKGTLAGAAGTALASGLLAAGAIADAEAAPVTADPPATVKYPFFGTHQSGIVTPLPPQAQATFAAFDLTVTGRSRLRELLATLTERSRVLTAGGPPPNLGAYSPPADSDVIGPVVPTDGLTITVGAGSSLFDHRFGVESRAPRHLVKMTAFPNDNLDETACHGDLMVQICADHQDTVHHAIRDITRHTRGGMQLRWRYDGFRPPPRPAGAPRNLLGFKDGTANPPVTESSYANSLIWVQPNSDEPAWATGGSYQVVRLIRMFVEFWDRVSIVEQQGMFGRNRDTGAPLDGTQERDAPNFTTDPHGKVIPLNSHIRLANPRTPATADQRFLRRSYSYDQGDDRNGNLNVGHVFVAYNQDFARQFLTVQKRLIGEPLVDYVQPFGGGYFFAFPGVSGAGDHFGSGLFA